MNRFRLYEYDGFTGGWKLVIESNNVSALREVARLCLSREWEIRELREVKVEEGSKTKET